MLSKERVLEHITTVPAYSSVKQSIKSVLACPTDLNLAGSYQLGRVLLVGPVRSISILGLLMHLGSADLHFDGHPSRAPHSSVQGLVA